MGREIKNLGRVFILSLIFISLIITANAYSYKDFLGKNEYVDWTYSNDTCNTFVSPCDSGWCLWWENGVFTNSAGWQGLTGECENIPNWDYVYLHLNNSFKDIDDIQVVGISKAGVTVQQYYKTPELMTIEVSRNNETWEEIIDWENPVTTCTDAGGGATPIILDLLNNTIETNKFNIIRVGLKGKECDAATGSYSKIWDEINISIVDVYNLLPIVENKTQDTNIFCYDYRNQDKIRVNFTYDVYDEEEDTIKYAYRISDSYLGEIVFQEDFKKIGTDGTCEEDNTYIESSNFLTNITIYDDLAFYYGQDFHDVQTSGCRSYLLTHTDDQSFFMEFGKDILSNQSTNLKFAMEEGTDITLKPYALRNLNNFFDMNLSFKNGNLTIKVNGTQIYNSPKDPIGNKVNTWGIRDNMIELNLISSRDKTDIQFIIYDSGEEDTVSHEIYYNMSGYSGIEFDIEDIDFFDSFWIDEITVYGYSYDVHFNWQEEKIEYIDIEELGNYNYKIYITDTIHESSEYIEEEFDFRVRYGTDCKTYEERSEDDIFFAAKGAIDPLMDHEKELREKASIAVWLIWVFTIIGLYKVSGDLKGAFLGASFFACAGAFFLTTMEQTIAFLIFTVIGIVMKVK